MKNSSPIDLLISNRIKLLTSFFILVSSGLIYLVYSEQFIFGSSAGNWAFRYFPSIRDIPFNILFITAGMTGLLIFIGTKMIRNYEVGTLAVCFLIAVLIQVLIQSTYKYSMDQIIESKNATSFYRVATEYSPLVVLAKHQELASSFPIHAKANMPGKILFFHSLMLLTNSRQVMGYLIIAFSTVGGLFLYGICKRLFQDINLAFSSFLLYVLMPTKQVWFPILNTITPVFILASLYIFLVYLDKKSRFLLVLLGISIYFLILFEPSPLATGLIFIAILINAIGQKKVHTKEVFWILGIPTITLAATWLFFLLVFSFDLLKAFLLILKDASEFNTSAGRGYLIWIVHNLKEFVFTAGLPVTMISIFMLINFFSQKNKLSGNILTWSIENLYIASLTITFCIVLFLGINRGETTRLWIYLAVFFQIPAAFFISKVLKSNLLFFITAFILLAQSVVVTQRIILMAP